MCAPPSTPYPLKKGWLYIRTNMSQARKGSIAFILITLLLDTLGIGLVIPVMPRLFADFLGGDLVEASKYYGPFISMYAAMQFAFAPIIAGLSDRFGRRPVILSALLGMATNYIVLALAPTLPWLFAGRIVVGITGASFSAANAYIADITPPERRAQSFGMVGAAFGLGFVLGPALGGTLSKISLRLPFYVSAGLNLLNFCYGLFVLPESLKPENRRPFSFKRANPFATLRNVSATPILLGLTGTIMCGFLSQQMLQSTWAVYTDFAFGWDTLSVGLSLGVVGLGSAFVQGFLVRKVIPWAGERRSILFGMSIGALGFLAFSVATKGWMMYAILVPFVLSGLSGPAIQALITKEVEPNAQGELQGSIASLNSLMAIVGPVVGNGLFRSFTKGVMGIRFPGAAFLAAALLNLLGMMIAARLFARTPAAEAKPKA